MSSMEGASLFLRPFCMAFNIYKAAQSVFSANVCKFACRFAGNLNLLKHDVC